MKVRLTELKFAIPANTISVIENKQVLMGLDVIDITDGLCRPYGGINHRSYIYLHSCGEEIVDYFKRVSENGIALADLSVIHGLPTRVQLLVASGRNSWNSS